FQVDADHVRHAGRVEPVLARRAVLAVVVVLPVLHEEADHVVALLLEQPGRDGRIHAAREPHHDPVAARARWRRAMKWLVHALILSARARDAEQATSHGAVWRGRCIPATARSALVPPSLGRLLDCGLRKIWRDAPAETTRMSPT